MEDVELVLDVDDVDVEVVVEVEAVELVVVVVEVVVLVPSLQRRNVFRLFRCFPEISKIYILYYL